MEEEGCKLTLITYNVILNVYWEIGMPWKKITEVFDGMRSSGVAPDAYTYNTLISSCRQGTLSQEAKQIFEEMKVFEEIKLSGCSPNIVTPDLSTYTYLALSSIGTRRKKSEVTPDAITYNIFVASYAANAMFI
ncbi:hypothetical protein POM88_019048 [Heracleum sosnowskyi]|uniref:Pentatricopeptide repeat-containing protein n=1 Tax=Heracleum sosnowskyi TaxID=360622 RepID=A0AAD8MV97_9APIA|nr:hypothetical protein POM88_019048 [Heracleum sosnowskyi]